MEVYAGFLAQTDAEVGRLVKCVKDLGVWDNTLFIPHSPDDACFPCTNSPIDA